MDNDQLQRFESTGYIALAADTDRSLHYVVRISGHEPVKFYVRYFGARG